MHSGCELPIELLHPENHSRLILVFFNFGLLEMGLQSFNKPLGHSGPKLTKFLILLISATLRIFLALLQYVSKAIIGTLDASDAFFHRFLSTLRFLQSSLPTVLFERSILFACFRGLHLEVMAVHGFPVPY